MDKVRVYHDRTGNTLTVWFGDPKKETVRGSERRRHPDEGQARRVIGFERLNYLAPEEQVEGGSIPVEVQVS